MLVQLWRQFHCLILNVQKPHAHCCEPMFNCVAMFINYYHSVVAVGVRSFKTEGFTKKKASLD